jgi:hypothetical protein
VIVDVGCRNTVFNGELQSAAALVPEIVARGVRRFRFEFVPNRTTKRWGFFPPTPSCSLVASRRGKRARAPMALMR